MAQHTIRLPDELSAFVEHQAAQETREFSQQVRHYIALAARAAGWHGTGSEPDNPSGNPPLPIVTPDNIGEVRAELAELDGEIERLTAAQAKQGWRFLPDQERRLSYIRSRAGAIRQHVNVVERSMGVRRDV